MSIRSALNTKKRRLGLIVLLGIGIMLLGVATSFGLREPPRELPIVFFAGFLVTFVGLFSGYITIRCPQCKNLIGYQVMWGGSPFSVSKNFNYCPSCGVNLDSNEPK